MRCAIAGIPEADRPALFFHTLTTPRPPQAASTTTGEDEDGTHHRVISTWYSSPATSLGPVHLPGSPTAGTPGQRQAIWLTGSDPPSTGKRDNHVGFLWRTRSRATSSDADLCISGLDRPPSRLRQGLGRVERLTGIDARVVQGDPDAHSHPEDLDRRPTTVPAGSSFAWVRRGHTGNGSTCCHRLGSWSEDPGGLHHPPLEPRTAVRPVHHRHREQIAVPAGPPARRVISGHRQRQLDGATRLEGGSSHGNRARPIGFVDQIHTLRPKVVAPRAMLAKCSRTSRPGRSARRVRPNRRVGPSGWEDETRRGRWHPPEEHWRHGGTIPPPRPEHPEMPCMDRLE